ncbi:Golgi apparatus membrane protein tvp18 [Irineochytrium annulatum]|nr:Golgi apparatus membrane protein tvp18 [Irineochytrium annulatum]
MGFVDEWRSGKFTVYAQWAAILSGVFLIILGFVTFTSVLPFALLAFVQSFLIVLLEVPIVTQCCPTGPMMSGFVKFFENTIFRSVLYLVFAGMQWISLLMAASALLVAAMTLSVTFVLYAIAASKKEEFSRSYFTGGKGVSGTAASGGAAGGGAAGATAAKKNPIAKAGDAIKGSFSKANTALKTSRTFGGV